jgi:hypothetical protein
LLPGALINKGSASIGGQERRKAVGIQKTAADWRQNQRDEASLADFVMWIKVGRVFRKTHTKVAYPKSMICNLSLKAQCTLKRAIHS